MEIRVVDMILCVDAAEQVYAALVHASARLRQLDQDLGLSPSRFSVLATLRYEGPRRLGDLARGEGVSQPTMTQTVHGLEAADLVVRESDPHDGRGCIVRLTPKGRALVRRARSRKIAWIDDALCGLGHQPTAALRDAAAALDHHALGTAAAVAQVSAGGGRRGRRDRRP
jgi:DNA-binding MarR family transcriptional regulator